MQKILFLLASVLCLNTGLHAAYLVKNGSFINQKDVAYLSLEDHYQLGIDALKKKEWDEAVRQFQIVTVSFKDAALAQEAHYYLAVAYYEENELEGANKQFSTYLGGNSAPSHYEDSYRYKLAIAERLAKGERRHLFGCQSLPKLMTGRGIALQIFDEVASSLAYHDLAAKALLDKAELLKQKEDFLSSIDTYESVLRRFPQSAFAEEAYLGIASSYKAEITREPQNTDAMALAEINVKEMKKAFPQSEAIRGLEEEYQSLQEIYANALYETGCMYERMGEDKAAFLYYHAAIHKVPNFSNSVDCRDRIKELSHYAEELHISL